MNKIFTDAINEFNNRNINIDPHPFHFRIFNPKISLLEGMRAVMHHDVVWLNGYDEIVDWLNDNYNKGLLLIGPTGVGKTEICMKVIPLIFWAVLKRIISRFSATDLSNPKNYKEAMTNTLLVVDDVGTETIYNNYGTQHIVFSEIVDRIEKDGVLLIANTNLNDIELQNKYGIRTMDRIRGNMRIVIICEDSLRGHFEKIL